MSPNKLSPERLERLKGAFDRAIQHSAKDRCVVLETLLSDDPELHAEAIRLAGEYDLAGDFFQPIVPQSTTAHSDSPERAPLFAPGQRICARYEIIRLIGSGGMGEVYEAQDPNLGRRIALKTVRLDRLSSPKAHERLRREALLALQVTHPNVCRILDLNWHDLEGGGRVAVLTMVLLEGRTLAEVLKEKRRFTTVEALPLISQMVAALDACHSKGMVHRDFKPSNVILNGSQVVVMDFGLAVTDFALRGDTLTSTGQLIGTPEYMSPEQLRAGEATAKSDIYALGIVMFEMLTGERPHRGATGIDELLKRISEPAPSPRTLIRDLPRRWDVVIRCALDPDPNRRFRSASELEAALRSGRPVLYRPTRRQALTAAASVAAVSLSAASYRYWIRRPGLMPGAVCMVTPIHNSTRDSRLDAYATLLRIQLEQSTQVRSWDSTRLTAVLTRMRRNATAGDRLEPSEWREVAMREGVPLATMGTLSRVGDDYVLEMRLEKIGTSPAAPARHWNRTFRAQSVATLMEGAREVANWIREQSGEIAESIAAHSRPAAEVTTSSWDALMLYQRGDAIARLEPEKAVTLLREAVRIDPDFALAQMRLGDVLVTLRLWNEGLPYWESALSASKRNRLMRREELRLQTLYSVEIGDYPAAEAAAQRWSEAFPNDERARWEVFSTRYLQGKVEEGHAGLGTLPATPLGRRLQLIADAQYYLWRGDVGALLNCSTGLAELGDSDSALRMQGIAAAIGGDFDKAKSAFRKMTELSSSTASSRGFALLATLLSSVGRLEEADRALQEGISHDENVRQPAMQGNKLTARAYIGWISDRKETCRTTSLEAARVTRDPDVRVRATLLLRRSGFIVEASKLDAELNLLTKYPRFRVSRELIDGEALMRPATYSAGITKIEDALRGLSPNYPPESLLYCLWRSGDMVRFRAVASSIKPWRIWCNPELQLGPVTLLLNRLTFLRKDAR